jgi:hypothetical protein
MPDLYDFQWPVDADGYVVENIRGAEYVRARGGSNQNYRPMTDEPGLWRELAEKGTSTEGILKFVTAYGLLDPQSSEENGRPNERIGLIWGTADTLRKICDALDPGQVAKAAEIFTTQFAPRLRARIRRNDKGGRFEFFHVPETLRAAILLQAGEAITGNRKFRRCACPGCGRWFQLGRGGHTTRRKYCDGDACRMAAYRKRKNAKEQRQTKRAARLDRPKVRRRVNR